MPKRRSIPQVGLGVDELCEPMAMMSKRQRGRPPAANPKVNRVIRIRAEMQDRHERMELIQKIDDVRWKNVSTDQLRRIVAILDEKP